MQRHPGVGGLPGAALAPGLPMTAPAQHDVPVPGLPVELNSQSGGTPGLSLASPWPQAWPEMLAARGGIPGLSPTPADWPVAPGLPSG